MSNIDFQALQLKGTGFSLFFIIKTEGIKQILQKVALAYALIVFFIVRIGAQIPVNNVVLCLVFVGRTKS